MDAEEFRRRGKEMVDYVADYLENIEKRPVFPDVEPGYLRPLIPDEAPEKPETWEEVMKDVERVVMPGVTHWHHPNFFAYFPAANSYTAITADILSDAIGCIGFTWATSPSCTELEMVMMDWLAKMLQLPEEFLHGGKGGGVIQGTASESTLVALYAARARACMDYRKRHPEATNGHISDRLVGYCSDQAHSSVERAGLIAQIRIRKVKSDAVSREMRGDALLQAMDEDRADGLLPFFCVATLGTTGCCAFDRLQEIGEVCDAAAQKGEPSVGVWLHVDAAYAGSSFICPENRPLLDGVERAMSFNFNPHKWLLVNFDCSAMWFKDASYVVDCFNVDPLYLQHDAQGKVPDFRHWHIPLGRRFRSLKLWFVFRLYGVEKLQNYIRNHINLALEFKKMILNDGRFELVGEIRMGLVCFIIKNDDLKTRKLNDLIKSDGRIHITPAEFEDSKLFYLRFTICHQYASLEHVQYGFNVIRELCDKLTTAE